MSWDQYVDSMAAYSKDASNVEHIDKGCIIGLDGGAKWTTDEHVKAFKLTPKESVDIAKCFKNNDYTTFQSSGIHVEGEKYQFLRVEDKVVLGKKKQKGAITLQCTKTAIVIARCPEGGQHGMCNSAVAKIVDYLESAGY